MREATVSLLVTWQTFYILIGIHNAWDSVTFITIELSQPENRRQE
jgi:hypothetical protein